jgi:hypothetical protein
LHDGVGVRIRAAHAAQRQRVVRLLAKLDLSHRFGPRVEQRVHALARYDQPTREAQHVRDAPAHGLEHREGDAARARPRLPAREVAEPVADQREHAVPEVGDHHLPGFAGPDRTAVAAEQLDQPGVREDVQAVGAGALARDHRHLDALIVVVGRRAEDVAQEALLPGRHRGRREADRLGRGDLAAGPHQVLRNLDHRADVAREQRRADPLPAVHEALDGPLVDLARVHLHRARRPPEQVAPQVAPAVAGRVAPDQRLVLAGPDAPPAVQAQPQRPVRRTRVAHHPQRLAGAAARHRTLAVRRRRLGGTDALEVLPHLGALQHRQRRERLRVEEVGRADPRPRIALAVELAARHGEADQLGRAPLLERAQRLRREPLVLHQRAELLELGAAHQAEFGLEDLISQGPRHSSPRPGDRPYGRPP